jgi:hypothetical protein
MAREGSFGGGSRPFVPPGADATYVPGRPFNDGPGFDGGGSDVSRGGFQPGVDPRGFPAALDAGRGVRRGFTGQNDPSLPANLLGRYAPTNRFNTWMHAGNSDGWKSIAVDRPTILFPMQQLLGRVFYLPEVAASAVGSYVSELTAQHAFGPGVIFLWAPGIWYVRYDSLSSAAFRQISADDPAIVAAAMSEPGHQTFVQGRLTTSATPNTAEQLVGQNLFRRSITITVGTPSTPKVSVGFNATVDAASGSQLGLILSGQGASVTLTRETLWKGPIFVAADIASVNITYLDLS